MRRRQVSQGLKQVSMVKEKELASEWRRTTAGLRGIQRCLSVQENASLFIYSKENLCVNFTRHTLALLSIQSAMPVLQNATSPKSESRSCNTPQIRKSGDLLLAYDVGFRQPPSRLRCRPLVTAFTIAMSTTGGSPR
ncbi:hypothetical protein L1887_45872 [Cichorium endivia]|nr:hypothetical protein L1887_45872 [Cichorium endivia]